MAKHIVKCAVCGEQFDLTKIQGVRHGARRYAHWKCYKQGEIVPMKQTAPKNTESKSKNDRVVLTDYLLYLFGSSCNWPRINKDITKLQEEGYKITGMYYALKWWFEIKGSPVEEERADQIMNIIPYIYNQAKKHYEKIDNAFINNEGKTIPDLNKYYDCIQIKPQQLNGFKPKLFNLEEINEQSIY